MRRREFVLGPVQLYGFAAFTKMGITTSNSPGVKALAFDVFGTVVDWRGSIIREGANPQRRVN